LCLQILRYVAWSEFLIMVSIDISTCERVQG
jgi:hypothetical protein